METTNLSIIVLYDEIWVFLPFTSNKTYVLINPYPILHWNHMFVQITLITLSVTGCSSWYQ